MRWIPALLLVSLALLAAGCGSKREAATTSTTIPILPDVRTSDEWAQRIVNRFLGPVNKDLQVLNGLNNPQIQIYIASGNPTTLNAIDRRMTDLEHCTDKLVTIGPPTTDDEQFQRVDRLFHSACANYEKVAAAVLDAVPLLSSGRTDVIQEGQKRLRKMIPASEAAARDLKKAIEIAQKRPEFRNAGLQSSS
jgi:hypothetical protein